MPCVCKGVSLGICFCFMSYWTHTYLKGKTIGVDRSDPRRGYLLQEPYGILFWKLATIALEIIRHINKVYHHHHRRRRRRRHHHHHHH